MTLTQAVTMLALCVPIPVAVAADGRTDDSCPRGAQFSPRPGIPVNDPELIGAMAQQQQAIASMANVMIQMLLVQQETLAALREIQAHSGGARP